MQLISVREFGPPEVMELVEQVAPSPAAGEVLVRVKAIGVNPVETYIRAGTYPRLPELPYCPGGNVAGLVEACGDESGGWQVGDRVYSSATVSGAYAQQALCRTDQLFSLPDRLSFSQGAALGVPAATAWRALFIRGGAKKGESVLVHGASGSVGQAALQLASFGGLQCIGTAGTKQGLEVIKSLGSSAADHTEPDYPERLLELNGGTGFDLILEMLANVNLERDLELLAPGGRVVIIGSRGRIEIDPRALMGKESEIRGLAVFNASEQEIRDTHAGLAEAIAAGALLPRVVKDLPLSEAPLAHRLVLERGISGKIVLIP